MRQVVLTLSLAFLIGIGLPSAHAQSLSPKNNFILKCVGCHGPDGTGSEKGGIPDFNGFVGAFSYLPEGRLYLMHVPGVVGSGLNDQEIADVMNYLMHEWGGESMDSGYQPFTEHEVQTLRAKPLKDVVDYRRTVVEKLTADGRAVAPYPWP
jgi:cytochrome c553